MSNNRNDYTADEELELFLEAARRANWDALHGPQHLRSGRFRPWLDGSPSDATSVQDAGTVRERGKLP
ncbi:MAG: hypothetical protein MJD61_15730 [Proteobacteria bacterium]|nr:hypothetical protein [Pseudomonadota bacterium]